MFYIFSKKRWLYENINIVNIVTCSGKSSSFPLNPIRNRVHDDGDGGGDRDDGVHILVFKIQLFKKKSKKSNLFNQLSYILTRRGHNHPAPVLLTELSRWWIF